MPIKFRCLYCNQLLGIARRKAGSVVNCPKCSRAVTVPVEESLTASRSERSTASLLERRDFDRILGVAGEADELEELIEEPNGKKHPESRPREIEADVEVEAEAIEQPPVVEERRTAFVPDEQAVKAVSVAAPPIPATPKPIGRLRETPRYSVLATMAAVALLLFVFCLGVVVGRYVLPANVHHVVPQAVAEPKAEVGKPEIQPEPAQPDPQVFQQRPVLFGVISFKNNQQAVPDNGATVLVFPSAQTPAEKIPSLGLRPLDQNLQDKPGIEVLRKYGGEFAIVDDLGEFRIEVDRPGLYYVLVMSRHVPRGRSETIYLDDASILRRFFADGEQVLGSSSFLLVTRELKTSDNDPIRFTF